MIGIRSNSGQIRPRPDTEVEPEGPGIAAARIGGPRHREGGKARWLQQEQAKTKIYYKQCSRNLRMIRPNRATTFSYQTQATPRQMRKRRCLSNPPRRGCRQTHLQQVSKHEPRRVTEATKKSQHTPGGKWLICSGNEDPKPDKCTPPKTAGTPPSTSEGPNAGSSLIGG
jgi:hypothetical protein